MLYYVYIVLVLSLLLCARLKSCLYDFEFCSVHLVVTSAPVNTMQYLWFIRLSYFPQHICNTHTDTHVSTESLHSWTTVECILCSQRSKLGWIFLPESRSNSKKLKWNIKNSLIMNEPNSRHSPKVPKLMSSRGPIATSACTVFSRLWL